MKQTSIKLLLLTFFMLFGTLVLAGCGGDKPKEATAPANAPSTPAESQKTPDDKEIISGLLAKGQEIKEMSYDMVMIGAGVSSESKVWLKGNTMKSDSVLNGQRFISIFDLTKDEVISYLPGDKMASKMKIEEYQGQDSTTPLDYILQLGKTDFHPTGNETVNGMECKVISISSADGSYKEWLSTDYGIVVKVKGNIQGQDLTLEYKNIKVGEGSVSQDAFKLPKGVEVVDLREMTQNSPKSSNP